MRRLAATLVATTLLLTMPAIGDQVALGAAVDTTTTVVSNHNPSVHGQGVTFTATVTATPVVSTITNYTDTDHYSISFPHGIAAGSDGALWFTNYTSNSIGRIDAITHAVANYTYTGTGTGISNPQWIAAGPDGALWFTNVNNSIGRITVAGTVANYTGTGVSNPYGITAGSDGALWFSNHNNNSIGRIDATTHEVANYTGTGISAPYGITGGPDGALWFANVTNNSIGRIDATTHEVANYTGTGISSPTEIATGPDGALWFANNGNNSIGRIDATTHEVANFTGTGISGPWGIVAGPDGALWFTNVTNNSIGRIDVITHEVANYTYTGTGTGILYPQSIAAGPDGALWFVNVFNDSIGRITAGATPTGTVNFKDGGTTITGCATAPLNGIGQATCGPLTDLSVGDHPITAVYSGDATFNTSTSPNLTQTVNNKAATSTTVASDTDPSVFGRPVTFTATVTTAVTSGTVTFKDGGTTIPGCGTAPLNGIGQATCGPLTDLSVGDHPITAVYSGDANFNSSTSAALTQTITPSSTVDTTLPVTGDVEVGLRMGGEVSSAPLLLTWSASDNVTLPADLVHQVQMRRLKHGDWGPWTNVATVTGNQLETARPLWRHYQYRVQTRDQAGNWGAWAESASMVLLRRDEGQFRESSGWTTLPMAGAMRGAVARSSIVGSWARLRFWGSGVALVMPTGVGQGSIEVCVDAGTPARQCQNVDLSTFTSSGQRRLVAVFNGLTNGLHHLRVRVIGGTVNLDGALISR